MRLLIFILLLGVFSTSTKAQEHPFLGSFSVSPGFGAVDLKWTMVSGSTCFGIQILRSFDGLVFEQIGEIEGLCGNVSEPVDYQFRDTSPATFRTQYYKLELGLNGPSSVQEIYFDQLRQQDQLVVYDNNGGGAEIYLRIPTTAEVELLLYDVFGKLILSERIGSGYRIRLPRPLESSGIYLYSVNYNGRKYSGRVSRVL